MTEPTDEDLMFEMLSDGGPRWLYAAGAIVGGLKERDLNDSRSARVVPPDALLLSYPEAATLLGVSVDALYQRVSSGRIPSRCVLRTGRRVQFKRQQLESWINGGKP